MKNELHAVVDVNMIVGIHLKALKFAEINVVQMAFADVAFLVIRRLGKAARAQALSSLIK